MKFLWFNTGNGYQPEVRTKTGIYGQTLNNETLSKQRNLLITGPHHSGKTQMLDKLERHAEKIWAAQIRPYAYTRKSRKRRKDPDKPVLRPGQKVSDWQFPDPVTLSGIAPISKWIEHEGMAHWWDQRDPDKPFKKLAAWKRAELLPNYLTETRAILMIDDAHRLTGRKLQIAKMCVGAAYRIVMTSSDENRLAPSLRRAYLDTQPQVVRLNSEVAYDATHVLTWFCVVLVFLAGSPEMAMALGVFDLLKGGRRASKQD